MFRSPRLQSSWMLLAALAATAAPRAAAAQSEPKFVFGKPDEAKPEAPPVEWKAQAKGGFVLTSGNSQATNGTLALTTSRKEGNNRLSFDAALAYGRSNVIVPVLADPATTPPTITGFDRRTVVSTNNWLLRGRYDRFITTNNSAYASGQVAADRIAGKEFFGGGQIGYSRQLLKTAMHTLVAEIGYDYSYESYVQQPMKTIDPVSIHSARLFVGEIMKLTSETGITASVESFLNLNKETKALNASGGGALGVDPFHDTRVIGKLGLTTTLRKRLSLGAGVTVRYDQNPAPLPIPSGAPAGAVLADDFVPFAEHTDFSTELTLVYTFL
jgi:enamine deaminase RidA (YjgF/YER057c/UK114 family)